MPVLPAILKPADPERLNREHLPTIPAWFPLPGSRELIDPDTGLPTGKTPEQVRRAYAITAACEGPHDGQPGGKVQWPEGGAPPDELAFVEGQAVYRLSRRESNERALVYRYSPGDSLIHPTLMRAVEDAFSQAGPQYAQEAREDDTTAFGYADRHAGAAFGL